MAFPPPPPPASKLELYALETLAIFDEEYEWCLVPGAGTDCAEAVGIGDVDLLELDVVGCDKVGPAAVAARPLLSNSDPNRKERNGLVDGIVVFC